MLEVHTVFKERLDKFKKEKTIDKLVNTMCFLWLGKSMICRLGVVDKESQLKKN